MAHLLISTAPSRELRVRAAFANAGVGAVVEAGRAPEVSETFELVR